MSLFPELGKTNALDRPTAWACFVANMIVLPGLGSIIARKRSGYIQAALALIGFGLTIFWGAWFLSEWFRTKKLPIELEWHLLVGAIGAVIFLIGWVWAFVSGVRIVRGSRKRG